MASQTSSDHPDAAAYEFTEIWDPAWFPPEDHARASEQAGLILVASMETLEHLPAPIYPEALRQELARRRAVEAAAEPPLRRHGRIGRVLAAVRPTTMAYRWMASLYEREGPQP